ncbi:Spc19-domain-containing protein [Pseudoneurospora amorphoporcata]|uniref:DASH complex subunit SPC19 n=1 Tax=Pseudoneurospora amorphoporcata TaxID=241081 RepID=A0AAN6NV91_9PEZI|nr:Spc19-domain-containing protein [Pseudoneurospora amorphoporcata]
MNYNYNYNYNPPPPSFAALLPPLHSSLNLLSSSLSLLDSSTSDFPRLSSVLKTVRHYELIPQPTLQAAEASLRDEIGPFIELLLERVDKELERKGRRVETLKARCELNGGRLSNYNREQKSAGGGIHKNLKGGKKLNGEAALRAKVVRQRKEALKYSVERLEMEVAQKERELRMRLEQQGGGPVV